MIGKDALKALRAELAAAGCDISEFKRWQKSYEKMGKQLPGVRERYESALSATQDVHRIAWEMEKIIADGAFSGSDAQARMAELFHELKRRQGTFCHEFIVSPDDREVSSTYAGILAMGTKALSEPDSRLILQSEVENLTELLKENLAKEKPDMVCLASFYAGHGDGELSKLPPAARLAKIRSVYEKEIKDPLESLMSGKISGDRAQEIIERLKQ